MAERVRGRQFQDGAQDWRVLGTSGAGTWFDAPSHSEGAALVRRIVDLADGIKPLNIDLRIAGVQVWIPEAAALTTADLALAQEISAAARDLGLAADPSVPQDLEWAVDTLAKPTLLPFWQSLLGYTDGGIDDLLDPLRRDPRVWFHPKSPTPLRNRIHFDVALPRELAAERAAALKQLGAGGDLVGSGDHPLVDPEGNEVDLVPSDDRAVDPETADWQRMFSGLVFYPTKGHRQPAELATRVAQVADSTGMPLMIDLRADGVMIDTGKDRWEDDDRFPETARRVQSVARELGLVPDPTRLRFFQACIDAVDILLVREFWRAVLGYRNDNREFVTDIYDPRRLNHPMIFQQMDPTDQARRAQRNRIHLDLCLPDDQVSARIDTALAAGGRISYDGGAPAFWTIADPEGNEVDIATSLAPSD